MSNMRRLKLLSIGLIGSTLTPTPTPTPTPILISTLAPTLAPRYTAYTCASFPRHPNSQARFIFFLDAAVRHGLPRECSINPNIEIVELGQ